MGLLITILLVLCLLVILSRLWCFWCRSKVCLIGKTAIVTGGASGLGYETALALAAKGCRVIIADISNSAKAAEEVRKKSQNNNIVGKYLDLGSFKSVRAFAKEIIEKEPRLDILMCNAGMPGYREMHMTEDNLERVMQVNYFGHFLLVHLLLDLLKKSSPSRIVFTSSVMAYISNLTIDNLTPKDDFFTKRSAMIMGGTYSNSKLCCAAAAKSFGEKLQGFGVTANAVQVSGVRTPIFYKAIKENRYYSALVLGSFVWVLGKNPEEGAQTLIHLAHAAEVESVTGQTFMEGKQVWRPSKLTEEFCAKLWTESVKLTKLEADEVKC
ncbi:unnamed protein product [Ceutorhynchus assimilis]|uniref:Uncharacterized protein n=1 Tax=Ceutorhynchus assimilis TaxID=467358 RepID=A0A9N9MG32_9CUCU|nr:unnamed protein product [Ceutorhynchus assimilis]